MSHPLQIFSQSDYLIRFTYLMTNSADPDQMAKPTGLDLHCLQRQGISRGRLGLKFENNLKIALDNTPFFSLNILMVFLFLSENICCGYLLEAPHQGASKDYPNIQFWRQITVHVFMMSFSLRKKIWQKNSYSTGSLGGSVGCAVRLETRRSRVQPPPRSATFFHEDWSWNIFYGHSLPSADSRRAVVSFWRKNVHNTG